MAIKNRRVNRVKKILGQIDERPKYALELAVMTDNFEIAKILVDNGISAVSQPLYHAAKLGDIRMVKLLVDNGCHPDYKTIKGYHPNSFVDFDIFVPINGAIEHGHFEIVKYLVEQGANVNGVKRDVGYPMMIAVLCGRLDHVKYLIEQGVELDSPNWPCLIHQASRLGHVNIIDFLLKNGSDINEGCPKKMYSLRPIHWAVEYERLAVMRFLLENGADVNAIRFRDPKKETPVDIANFKIAYALKHKWAKYPDGSEILSLLIEYGGVTFDAISSENRKDL